MYNAYVAKLKNVRKHPNADRLLLGECFGNTVCVGLDYFDNELGIYFPTDGQLSLEFAECNNLLRKKDENGNNIGGYMDPDKRNITAIKLRGEKSDGLFLHLSCLEKFGDVSSLKEGDIISTFNNHEIACKYIPRRNHSNHNHSVKKNKKKKENIAPLFAEHVDTEQLNYNLDAFKIGDKIEITLKMHGTSQRTGYLPVLKSYKKTLFDKILRRPGKPIYEYDYICGTRRTIVGNKANDFYNNDQFRDTHHEKFVGKLAKGETVYYEVVGFINDGTPIMSTCDNKKIGKNFIKQYGEKTCFSYGCESSTSECYVYRMTFTNEDGFVVEYSPDFMRYRCEQMGVKTVPVFANLTVGDKQINIFETSLKSFTNYEFSSLGECIKDIAEKYYDGPDPIGKTHVREGVVLRIINRPTFEAYKTKNFSFKVLEGIIKDLAEKPDMEEAQEIENN